MPLTKTPSQGPKQDSVKELSTKVISKIDKNPKVKAALSKLSDKELRKTIGKNLVAEIKRNPKYKVLKTKRLFDGVLDSDEANDVYDANVKCPDGQVRSLQKMVDTIYKKVKTYLHPKSVKNTV